MQGLSIAILCWLNLQYEKAASILKKNDPPITLAKFDAFEAVNKPIARLYKVSGFPTLKILNNGGKNVQDEYNGPRKADDLVKYVQKQLGPASVEIKSTNDAASVIDLAKSFIVSTLLINCLIYSYTLPPLLFNCRFKLK